MCMSISNNNMTGLFACHTAVTVKGIHQSSTTTLHGIDGGGLAMYDGFYLIFEENSFLNFTNNSAMQKGGAIFVEMQLPNSFCFFPIL